MKAILFFLGVVLTFLPLSLSAQTSVYRHFSGEELPFDKTYSSLIDQDGFLLIATFEGVYKFDGTNYNLLKQESNQLIILLKKTDDNRVFAIGINNSIFEIKNDSLELVFTHGTTISQSIDFVKVKNHLFITGNKNQMLKLNLETKKLDTVSINVLLENSSIGQVDPIYYENNLVYFRARARGTQFIGIYSLDSDKSLILRKIGPGTDYLNVFQFQQKNYLLITSPKVNKDSVFELYPNRIKPTAIRFKDLENKKRIRVFSSGNQFALGSYSGLEIFDSSLHTTHNLLKGKIITGASFIGDAIWVSTNSNGLYFFPNYKVQVINATPKDQIGNYFSQIISFKGHVLVSSINGKVFEVTKDSLILLNTNTLKNMADAPFKYKDAAKDTLYLPYITHDYLFFEKKGSIRSVKRYMHYGNKDRSYFEGMMLVSSHNGTTLFHDSTNWEVKEMLLPESIRNMPMRKRLDHQFFYTLSKERTGRNFYNSKDSSIWYGPGGKLCRINTNSMDTMRYSGELINVIELKQDEQNNMWFSDWNHIYRYNDSVQRIVSLPKEFEISNFTVGGRDVLIATNLGVIQYNLTTKKIRRINFADGLPSNDVYAVASLNDTLYAASKSSIGVVPVNSNSTLEKKSIARFTSVQFNASEYSLENKKNLEYDQNDLVVKVSSLNLTNIEGLSCFYKLEGIDEDWIQTNSNEPIRYPNLASGSYEFVAYFEDIDGGKSDAIRFQFTIQLPFWKRWWFILISAFTLIGITAFFITNRDKSQREKQQLSQRLVQSEIDGLKSQMNPHFIFNSLNSIQDLILMKDFKSSTIYLGKFSSLLRMTLEYSSKPKIYIKEEVELLSIYLELEALRFENGIQTKVEVQGDDIMQLTIPPLLIQPFVENALKHGLFQSQKAEKKLTVSFYKESDFLCCSIEDNGVGRKAAQAYNEKKLTNHNSYASKAIQKRVDLINQTLVTKIETKIIDLEEGTRVELRFPN